MRTQAGQIAARVLQDVWCEVSAVHWRRRADQLEAARPRRGDFTGRATPADIVDAHRRLTEAATACRNRATWLEASQLQFTHTLRDVTQPGVDQVLLAEQNLRAALDAGNTAAIRWWTQVLDQHEQAGLQWLTAGAAA